MGLDGRASTSSSSAGLRGRGSARSRLLGLTLSSDFDQGFSPSVAYYLVDNLALIAQATYSQREFDISGSTVDTTHTAFGAGLEFNIPTGGPVVPFVGVALLYASEEEDSPGTVDDIEVSGPATEIDAGVKFMVNERSSVNIFVSYLTGSLESTIAGSTGPDADVTEVSGGLGFSLYFP